MIGTKRYSVLFYSGETAAFISGREGLEDRLRDDPRGLGLTEASRSVRLFGDRRDLEDLRLPADRIETLERSGEQELWRVRREDLRS